MDEMDLEFREETMRLRTVASRAENAKLPAVSLPAELLGKIFLYTCSRDLRHEIKVWNLRQHNFYDRGREPSSTRIVRQLRLPLTATCSRWREIAISTTLLWNCISIRLQEPRRNDPIEVPSISGGLVPSLRQLQLELERSGTRPLQLRLEVRHFRSRRHDLPAPACWTDLSTLVKTALPRCKWIYLEFNTAVLLNEILGVIFTIDLPHLLSFASCPPIDNERSSQPIYNLSLAPRLRHLTIYHSIGDLRISPASTLTQLCLDRCIDFRVAVGILRTCDQIRQLSWAVRGTKEEIPQLAEDLVLPFLEYLEYHEWSDPGLESPNILRFINAPHTVSLDVSGPALPTQFPAVLNLHCMSTTGLPTFLESLVHFPALEELYVECCEELPGKDFLCALQSRAENGSWEVLPCLKHLKLDEAPKPRDVEIFLQARNANSLGGPALTLAIYGDEESTPPELEHLRHLGVVPFWSSYDPFQLAEW